MSDRGGFWKNVLGEARQYSNNAAGNLQSGVDVLTGGSKPSQAQSAAGGRYAPMPDVGTVEQRMNDLAARYSKGELTRAEYDKEKYWLDREAADEKKRKANEARAEAELSARRARR